MKDHLYVSELFLSFQGESTLMGRKTFFIRLSQCNLRCGFCDTRQALDKGKNISSSVILDTIIKQKSQNVCITGGEPILQAKELKSLISRLLDLNITVSLETNGSLPIELIDKRVKRVVDVKMPSSCEYGSFLIKNLNKLTKNDELKFVISDKKDFKEAVKFIKKNKPLCPILFSPNLSKKGFAHSLVKWILSSEQNIIFQPQLHKLIKEKPIYIKPITKN